MESPQAEVEATGNMSVQMSMVNHNPQKDQQNKVKANPRPAIVARVEVLLQKVDKLLQLTQHGIIHSMLPFMKNRSLAIAC